MKNVLLLEEDREGRETLARILKKRGFHPIPVKDDVSALAVLASTPRVDLVIASATERDRAEFLSDVRERKPRLPVIFLSDYCSPESRLRGLVYGAFSLSRSHNFYINMRPVTLHELDRLIRIALHRRSAVTTLRLAAA